ncbi:hypothetical protein [Saliphagus sp. LR7]|uniref:hypothetical protein n=1 Tax=Saliphagus sp. LR7 TaxID=2282654 RepID=UPI000DF81C1E|nr:hypothetical protein [Saliphagus sp. LR7]
MARTRALITETERQYISGEKDPGPDENKRYQAISRVRDRFDELETDVEVLETHHPELLEELKDVVCENNTSGE